MAWLLARLCLLVVSTSAFCEKGVKLTRGVDAQVMGLWAQLEAAIYQG